MSPHSPESPSSILLDLDRNLFASSLRESIQLLDSIPSSQCSPSVAQIHHQCLVRLTWCLLQFPASELTRSEILSLNRFHAQAIAKALDQHHVPRLSAGRNLMISR